MNIDIIRAWKDDSYRRCLSEEQLIQLPANPAGEFELTEADLQSVYGIGDGGLGNNNFNRLQNSFTCSIQCSLDCDIRNIYVTEPGAGKGMHLRVLGLSLVDLDSGGNANAAPAIKTVEGE